MMYKFTNILILAILINIVNPSFGLEYNRRQYNPNTNTDFLSHEAGGNPVWPKRDYVAPSNNDYNAQFPSLGSAKATHTSANPAASTTTVTSTKAPSRRDYVAPQLPTQKPYSTTLKLSSVAPQTPTRRPQPSGKRDYVAPQFPTNKPAVESSGNVKDLINFYDSKSKDENKNSKAPSYSSVIQSDKNIGSTTQTVTRPTVTPTKPLSFSAIVAGSNKPAASTTTLKPHRMGSPTSTSRPGSPILPSSIVNTNKNINQGNNNGPSDAELQTLSEELLRKDTNNAAKYITVNYQQKTTSQSSEDKAPQLLLTVAPEAWNIPTVQKLMPLLDNYERDTLVNEYVTAQERNEENTFMDGIMNTAVIRHLMNFLKERGYVSPDPKQQKDFLKQLWFNLYSRGRGKIGSSGFEHIFVSELKNGDVQGLHNWIYFSKEEIANRLNYLGYLKYEQLNDKGVVMKLHFNQQGIDKPVGTMFIGTSPELEIALYTLCFVTRADNDCKLKLGTKDVDIVTHTFRYRSKNYIGSAYPRI